MPQPNQVKQMTREIKFRAWDKSLEKYKYPVLWDNTMPSNWGHWYELEQFTGLKDTTTGADVYEGDIVKYQHSKNSTEYTGTIHYREDFASFWLTTNGDTGFALLGAQKVITVLGNIHQHPNLITCQNPTKY